MKSFVSYAGHILSQIKKQHTLSKSCKALGKYCRIIVENILDNEYVLDMILGISLFILIIFFILMINKAISKAVTYSGIGTIDKFFGSIFGIVKSYILVVCLFTAANIVYNYEKWPLNLKDSFTFPIVEKGSKYLIKEFPNEKEYQDAKEKVQDI